MFLHLALCIPVPNFYKHGTTFYGLSVYINYLNSSQYMKMNFVVGFILLSTVCFFIYIYLDDWDNAEILLPFFLQVIWGVGSPEAIHRNAAMPPAFTLMFCGDSRIIGGSGKRKFYRDNKWCSHFLCCLHDKEKVSCTGIQFWSILSLV